LLSWLKNTPTKELQIDLDFINQKKVRIGMSGNLVRLAVGKFYREPQSSGTEAFSEPWYYFEGGHIRFRDGKVSEVKTISDGKFSPIELDSPKLELK
jgi:hypothetical protein